MKLLTKDNKLYVYDEFSDKYYTIAEDDIEFIIDESETTPDGKPKLLPDEQVRRYLEDKYFPKKKTKAQLQGFYSKKVNLKKQAADVQTEIYNNALLQKLFEVVNDYENSHPTVKLSSTDRIKLIKKPMLNTIKSLSIPSELENLLEKAYNEFKETNTVDIDRGNENSIMSVLPDLLDIFVNNNDPQIFNNALRKRLFDLAKKYQESADILTHQDLYDRRDVEKATKKLKKLIPQIKQIKEDIGKTPMIDTNSVQLNNFVGTVLTKAENFMRQIEEIKNKPHVPPGPRKAKDDDSNSVDINKAMQEHVDKFYTNDNKSEDDTSEEKVEKIEEIKEEKPIPITPYFDFLDDKNLMNGTELEEWNKWKQDMPYDLKKLDRILDWMLVNNGRKFPEFKVDENNPNELIFHLSSDGEPIYNVHVVNTDENDVGKIYFDNLVKINKENNPKASINTIKKNLIKEYKPNDIKLQVKVVPINPDGEEASKKVSEQRKKFVESELNKDLFDDTLISDEDFYKYLLTQNENAKLVPWSNVKMKYKTLDSLDAYSSNFDKNAPLQFMYRNLKPLPNIPFVNKNFATTKNYNKFTKEDKVGIFTHDLYQYTPEEFNTMYERAITKSNVYEPEKIVKKILYELQHRKSNNFTNYPEFYKKLANEVDSNPQLASDLYYSVEGLTKNTARAIPIPEYDRQDNNTKYKKAKDINNPRFGDIDPTVFDDYISTMGFGNGSIAQLLASKLNSKLSKFRNVVTPRHHDPINMSVMLSKKLNSPK